MSTRIIGWDLYYQDDTLEIFHHSHETTFRIESSKYLVFLKKNDYLTVYPSKNYLNVNDRLYVNETSFLSFQDFFDNKINLHSEMRFNKIIDRILSMKAFS